ncbi:MAG: hypothetical protein JXB05_07045 [Myxococcaceae bacterium]|nr:hypothetical protein [Myxococcaceae bacterium]
MWVGCGGEVRTYQIAPYLEPGYTCVECSVSLAMRAREERTDDKLNIDHFTPDAFKDEGFTFKWGVEQRVELEVEKYSTSLQDDPGVRFTFLRVLETHPVEAGAHFTMQFRQAPPGHYTENMLVREGSGFLLQQTEHLECDSTELCDQLASRRLGEEGFVLELGYPEAEGQPLRLHAIQALP